MNDDDERTQQNYCGGNLHEFRLVNKKFTWISIEDKRSQQNDSDVIIYVTDGSELFIEDKRSQQNDADVIICVTDPSKVLKGELYVFERLPERFLKLVVEIPPS